jgi:hypothetical protein
MTGLRFLGALAALALIGYPFARRLGPGLPRAARWGLAGAAGTLVLCVEMVLATALSVRWSVGLLLLPAGVLAVLPRRRPAAGTAKAPAAEPPSAVAWAAIAAILGVVAYAAATARTTAADYVLFWGGKGARFGFSRAIDVDFLRDPFHLLMHPDYPPMLPCVYAWGTMVAGRFAWGAALLAMPFFLGLTVLTFEGFARPALGSRRSGEYACVLAALLALLMTTDMVGGDAEPLLLYFETLTLSALLFAGNRFEGRAAAAIGLAGAVLTKIEGTVFAGLVIVACAVIVATGLKRKAAALLLGLAPAAALSGWLAFCSRNRLLDIYRVSGRPRPSLTYLPTIVTEILRHAVSGWRLVPWLVVAALLVRARPSRPAVAFFLTAAGFIGFIVYMYSTATSDPTLWISWSAARILVTSILCAFLAAVGSDPAYSQSIDPK